jgi:uncharacterized membrane protein
MAGVDGEWSGARRVAAPSRTRVLESRGPVRVNPAREEEAMDGTGGAGGAADATGQAGWRRTAIAPFDCLGRAAQQMRASYWLLVGIEALGLVIMIATVCFAFLVQGAIYCGFYHAHRAVERGEPLALGHLWKGFEKNYVASLVATLLYLVGAMLVMAPAYALILPAFVGAGAAFEEHNEELGVAFLVLVGAGYLVLIVAALVVQTLFTYAYPLIVDRGLDGIAALKTSARAAWANFWGTLGLNLLYMLIACVAALLCFVPLFFVLPLIYGMYWAAYRKVFPALPDAAPAADDAWRAPAPT